MTSLYEIKAEALKRMRAIGLYSGSINAFEEYGQVHIYEPPYGCSYDIEEDDESFIEEFQTKNNALVWGVIRTFFKLSGEDLTGDSYLFVSKDESLWEEERELLYNGTPIVYTIIKEHPELHQIGNMNVYKSEAGTLLQDFPGRQ